MKRVLAILFLLFLLYILGSTSNRFQFDFANLSRYFSPKPGQIKLPSDEKVKVVTEESVVTDVVDRVSPSVVTVSIVRTRSIGGLFENDHSDPFGMFRLQPRNSQPVAQDIGTGFIVGSDGLIVTNKHVVADTTAKYKVITKDDKTYEVNKIFRDPVNDVAILKINDGSLKPVELGDSGKIKVGQMAIAIGTALGEFRNTVTVGVVSGLGRGITAGSIFEGSAERLDNVIQTDAAINPGNSGGPLLNSAGQVIGINVAVSAEGQNIGFAIPINVVKESLNQFNTTGKFNRPFLGVRYKMISRDMALLNEVPEGAYVQDVIAGSPADKVGIKVQDIITKIDGKKITDKDGGLLKVISDKKVGDKISVEIWRDGETKTYNANIGENTGE
jgi:S1-C subfamily serine protease